MDWESLVDQLCGKKSYSATLLLEPYFLRWSSTQRTKNQDRHRRRQKWVLCEAGAFFVDSVFDHWFDPIQLLLSDGVRRELRNHHYAYSKMRSQGASKRFPTRKFMIFWLFIRGCVMGSSSVSRWTLGHFGRSKIGFVFFDTPRLYKSQPMIYRDETLKYPEVRWSQSLGRMLFAESYPLHSTEKKSSHSRLTVDANMNSNESDQLQLYT